LRAKTTPLLSNRHLGFAELSAAEGAGFGSSVHHDAPLGRATAAAIQSRRFDGINKNMTRITDEGTPMSGRRMMIEAAGVRAEARAWAATADR
jgi:hypothetical protein